MYVYMKTSVTARDRKECMHNSHGFMGIEVSN
jgi:hypothetical protein